jgi:NAD(P)-dependent dehydrogenase (short-subunit alcohol dehydrogenase family)
MKRSLKCDLTGKIALVTGARIKIGYQICLALLRNGCRVIATSRFPHDCYTRYAQEADFPSFKDRLEIFPLDLRSIPSIAQFCQFLQQKLPYLDILINNAAQTLRRETGYYRHLIQDEVEHSHEAIPNLPRDFGYSSSGTPTQLALEHLDNQVCTSIMPAEGQFLPESVLTSQLQIIPESKSEQVHKFPQGVLDVNRQQVDLSCNNSWVLQSKDVKLPEFMEAQLINAWAPYFLAVNLKTLMLKTGDPHRFIVNVSSMEGIFSYRNKKATHPHTNMAKAALNMFTRTSAAEFMKDGIYMTSVDTGWVSMMRPLRVDDHTFQEDYCLIPLDEIDGAMRVLDPIFMGYNEKVYLTGVFLKDYHPSDW